MKADLRIIFSGGIRGVIELEILKRIQEKLCGIPIRECFDLIVGTR
jgi:patatin-like phospholipase/acyl hydrolase